jgi:hypothetical protein
LSHSRITLIVFFWLCLLAAPAQAGMLKRLDSSIGGVTTDGSRYAAYLHPPARHVRIVDTSSQTNVDWPVDNSCANAFEGSADGDVLLACQATDGFIYAVLSRTTGAVTQVPLASDPSAATGYTPGLDFLYALGTQWIAGGREQMTSAGGNYEVPLYVNRSTGERRLGGAEAIDLDNPTFTPFAGRCGPSDWWTTSSDPNYVMLVGSNGHLVLRHCSAGAILSTTVLSTCSSGCDELHYAAGIATWLERDGRLARAYAVSSRAFCAWTVPRNALEGPAFTFDHTAKAVFATVPITGSPPGGPSSPPPGATTIYSASLPC